MPYITTPFPTFMKAAILCLFVAAPALADHGTESAVDDAGKPVIYQVFTRLFGNTNTTNRPWGTIAENGVGKFDDFTDEALAGIREMGVSHVWYTGILHHATITNYTVYGISNDDPDVVKGRAGSPYAVKDYYSVAPDLARNPANRMDEFRALIRRTHEHGMKVMIDIIPNHVARGYVSLGKPEGVRDFGADDDTSVVYARDNNFYYVPGEDFEVPDLPETIQPLGGEAHPLADGKFTETPAKWTGNGARTAKPRADDWYETVRLNYGVRPDRSHGFPALPEGYDTLGVKAHAAFWADKSVPDTWQKMRDIALFWLAQGVDGFRYDVAELVPVAFWSYLNSTIKTHYPDAVLLAEVYNPVLYRDFIHLGKMDYLYDKVGLYDTLKAVTQGHAGASAIATQQESLLDIDRHMLHFLENHDEQRIASPDFAGSAEKGLPAMVVSTMLGSAPTMLYFGQTVGEDGSEDPGFGDPTRTSIFDYVGVPAHQRWMNGGAFDGGALKPAEKALRAYYTRLMQFSAKSPALKGQYRELHTENLARTDGYDDRLFSFARWNGSHQVIIVANFDDTLSRDFTLDIPSELVTNWGLKAGIYDIKDILGSTPASQLVVKNGHASIQVSLAPLQSVILTVGAASE